MSCCSINLITGFCLATDIEEVHPQTEVLNRVKRRPFDDDDVQFLSLEKRQVSGPRSSGTPGDNFYNDGKKLLSLIKYS